MALDLYTELHPRDGQGGEREREWSATVAVYADSVAESNVRIFTMLESHNDLILRPSALWEDLHVAVIAALSVQLIVFG